MNDMLIKHGFNKIKYKNCTNIKKFAYIKIL